MRFHYQNPEVLFSGKRVDLLSIEAQDGQGRVFKQEIVDHPGAVVILPFLDEEHVLLIRNERRIIQETLWELPAGTLEEGEEPLTCAFRELIEESGYEAKKITPVINFFSTPGFCNEKLFLFLAQDLHFLGQNLDEFENIEVHSVPFKKALEMVQQGVIHDAKTICALLYFHTFLS